MPNRSSGRIEPTLLLILSAALAAAVGLWLGARLIKPNPAEPMMAASSSRQPLERAVLYPAARDLPPFRFERHDHGEFTNADLQGPWSLLFFGFTTCPDVCPTTLSDLHKLSARLREAAPQHRLQIVFVSVDPERDTREKLASYVSFFDPNFLGLRAELEPLEAFTRSLGIVFMKVATGPGPFDYTIDHSSSILIINPEGKLVGLFRPPHDPEPWSRDLHRLMEGR